ncbi:MAG: NYN domain-containing protein [Desertimonas sp.]
MTTKSDLTDVVVVDGSNIATEGRSMPSLAQLNDAVMAFKTEFPDATVTVVVDATFGHRIGKSEVDEFDAAVAHNELVAPPAGAIGRGDAFVLSIANKVGARILSNDSFQEFHGDYPWLFDDGRLIGGKPVPFVGWVFVPRLPVKGPTSRRATRAARGDGRSGRRSVSKAASQPMPVPTAPPPGRAGRAAPADRARPAATEPAAARRSSKSAPTPSAPVADTPKAAAAPKAGAPVNELLPFIDFVERHPVGSSVNGVVESYSSHGAYVTVGDLRGYVPLRLMGDPPPRRAREIMKIGDAVTLVVHSFAPSRRSVDLAVPALASVAATDDDAVVETSEVIDAAQHDGEAPADTASSDASASPPEAPAAPTAAKRNAGRKKAAAKKAPAKRASARRPAKAAAATSSDAAGPAEDSAAAAGPASVTDEPSGASGAPDEGTPTTPTAMPAVKKRATKSASKRLAATESAPMKKTVAKKAATKRGATKKAATTTSVRADEPPAATQAPAKKAPAKKAPAKRAAAKAAAAEKTAPEPPAAKRAATKKATAKKATAKKAPAKKATAKKAPAKKAAATPRSRSASASAGSAPPAVPDQGGGENP